MCVPWEPNPCSFVLQMLCFTNRDTEKSTHDWTMSNAEEDSQKSSTQQHTNISWCHTHRSEHVYVWSSVLSPVWMRSAAVCEWFCVYHRLNTQMIKTKITSQHQLPSNHHHDNSCRNPNVQWVSIMCVLFLIRTTFLCCLNIPTRQADACRNIIDT